MHRLYLTPEELDADVARYAPPVVYKYRTWKDQNHRNLLLQQQLYYSHPFDLNDPKDVRPDYQFKFEEIQDQRYFEKLLKSADQQFPLLSADERREKAEEQWEYTKQHPESLVEQNKKWMATRSNFDMYGILSSSMDELSPQTWEVYGDNFEGYAMGLKTVEVYKDLGTAFGHVTYSDDPFIFTFLEDRDDLDTMYLKNTSWSYEREFRFYTLGIGLYKERVMTFAVQAAAEIVLGHNMSPDHEGEILKALDTVYAGQKLPVYKTKFDDKGRLIKHQVR